MKTSHDPRHLRRVNAMKEIFTWEFNPQVSLKSELAIKVVSNITTLDQVIEKAAPDRPIGQINKIDLAILRLATFELIIEKGVPFKVVVDEAVEIAKEFGATSGQAFVNGVLGNIITTNNLEKEEKT